MEKTFTVAGVSTYKQQVKVRFANDLARIKVLSKGEHTDINLIELPDPMTKSQIGYYLNSINFANGNAEVQYAINELMLKHPYVIPTTDKVEEVA